MLFRFPKFTSVTIIQELPFALIPNKSPHIRFSHVASIKNTTRHMISCYIAMRKRIQAYPCKRASSTIAHRHIRVFAWSLTANQIYSVINRCEDNQIPRVFPIDKSSSIGTWRCIHIVSDRLSAFTSTTEGLGLWLQDSITISTKHIDRRFNFLI